MLITTGSCICRMRRSGRRTPVGYGQGKRWEGGGVHLVDSFDSFDPQQVRLQTQDPRNPTYRGTYHCLQTIVRQESVRSLCAFYQWPRWRESSCTLSGTAAVANDLCK
jgi:hypothetical protein